MLPLASTVAAIPWVLVPTMEVVKSSPSTSESLSCTSTMMVLSSCVVTVSSIATG